MRTLFQTIDDFLVPKKRQNKYMVLMGFMGQEISRDGMFKSSRYTCSIIRNRICIYFKAHNTLF